jgi:hypothetical protein
MALRLLLEILTILKLNQYLYDHSIDTRFARNVTILRPGSYWKRFILVVTASKPASINGSQPLSLACASVCAVDSDSRYPLGPGSSSFLSPILGSSGEKISLFLFY